MLSKAALYSGGNLLYRIIHQPETLTIGDKTRFSTDADIAIDEISNVELSTNDEEIEEDRVFEEISEIENYTSDRHETKSTDEQQYVMKKMQLKKRI